ncbi:hypothetical protein CR513_39921, partial [Mucuna pruriens]
MALACFLSRSAETALRISHCLRKKKKAMLANPPILTRLTLGNLFLIYLSIFDNAVNETIAEE